MSGREVGAPVRIEMTKWGDRPHWAFDGRYLGADEHGEWIGFPRGTHHARPGLAFDSDVDSVSLLPPDGWHIATLHAPGIWCEVYVDVTGPIAWDGDVVRAVDLDLDVVRMAASGALAPPPGIDAGPGEVVVDDEDEFEEHRASFGYPDDVVERARASCAAVLGAVRAGEPPFDPATAAHWLARLSALGPTRP